jgi:nitroreductase
MLNKQSVGMDTDAAIRQLQTEKDLSDLDLPVIDLAQQRELIQELLLLAGQAPFHRACEEHHRHNSALTGIEPWRFYAVDAATCRKQRTQLPSENAGKIPAMLAAADALIIATWLPNAGEALPMDDEPGFALTLANMEHIAATAAAIENLLLAATARGLSNYWSSGGVLRGAVVRELLAIPATEVMLGAIFLFPQASGDAERVTSKLRPHRTPPSKWSRWVELS